MTHGEQSTSQYPHFVIEPIASEEQQDWLQHFEQRIHRDPVRYLRTLQILGPLATRDTIAIDETTKPAAAGVEMIPQADIYHYFTERLDRLHWYDDATDGALGQDEESQRLRHELSGQKSYTVRRGVMSSSMRPSEAAQDVRDTVRRYNLEFYMWQVIAARLAENGEAPASA